LARSSTTKAKGCAPTAGTRKGNGAGWGGAAKGEGNAAAGPGRPEGVGNGEGKRTVADLMIAAGGRELAARRWMEILDDPTHPHHATMVAKGSDRMDGASTQRVEIADKRLDEMTDEELAAIASRGSRGASSTAPD
jgi:hypothetical protein